MSTFPDYHTLPLEISTSRPPLTNLLASPSETNLFRRTKVRVLRGTCLHAPDRGQMGTEPYCLRLRASRLHRTQPSYCGLERASPPLSFFLPVSCIDLLRLIMQLAALFHSVRQFLHWPMGPPHSPIMWPCWTGPPRWPIFPKCIAVHHCTLFTKSTSIIYWKCRNLALQLIHTLNPY